MKDDVYSELEKLAKESHRTVPEFVEYLADKNKENNGLNSLPNAEQEA